MPGWPAPPQTAGRWPVSYRGRQSSAIFARVAGRFGSALNATSASRLASTKARPDSFTHGPHGPPTAAEAAMLRCADTPLPALVKPVAGSRFHDTEVVNAATLVSGFTWRCYRLIEEISDQ